MRKYILLFITIFILSNISNAQLFGRWVVPTKDMNSYTAKEAYQLSFYEYNIVESTLGFSQPSLTTQGYHYTSDGGYNTDYDLYFYTVSKNIYSDNNWLTNTPYANASDKISPEYQIINKPGNNYEYYALFCKDQSPNHYTGFFYQEIEYDPVTEEIDPSTPVSLHDGMFEGNVAFAITDEENGERYLYASTIDIESNSTEAGLRRWTINSSGISSKTEIYTESEAGISEDNFEAYNLELKTDDDDNTIIAWIHGEATTIVSELIVVTITSSQKSHKVFDLDLGRIGGIEFSAIDDDIIYVSCTNAGVIALDYTQTSSPYSYTDLNPTGSDYGKTFLQTAPDGNIYGVSNDGHWLGQIKQYGITTGSFEEDYFPFPTNEMVSTFRRFPSLTGDPYFILPENHRIFNEPLVEVTPTCPDHDDGTATITMEEGTAPYTFQLYDYNSGTTIGSPETTTNDYHTFTDLAIGDYYCEIIDSDNIVYKAYFTIEEVEFDVKDNLEDISSYVPGYWTNINSRSYKYGIRIHNNTSITISNSTLVFGKDAKIIIEPGSELVIDNTTLTNWEDCYDPWQGIEVWGVWNDHQYGSYGTCTQGKLILEGSSKIKNAICAVDLWKPGYELTTGGIIQAYDSDFENNAKSIRAYKYSNFDPTDPTQPETDNVSFINNCTFVFDDNHVMDNHTFYKHIDLAEVDGINFRGCDFSLSATNGASAYNVGIFATSAGFSVTSLCNNTYVPCTDYDNCNFIGFYNGVRAEKTQAYAPDFLVERANFINNSIGIYVEEVNYSSMLNNIFEVGYNPSDLGSCFASNSYGIDIHLSIGFAIEDNSFTKYSGAVNPGYYVGIRVSDCPSKTDVIYKNSFDNLSYGNYAYGINRDDHETDLWGVQYECNNNTNNATDFIVTGENHYEAMINTHHGIEGVRASGNKFSSISGSPVHFNNQGYENINWYYCPNPNNCPDEEPTEIVDICDDHFQKDCFTAIIAPEYDCPSHYEGGGSSIGKSSSEKQQLETEYALALSDFDNIKMLYDNLKDGGNTTSELLDVQTATPDDMWSLRTQLLGDSPHLSEEILKEVADRTDVFPESVIFDIMAANPDEMKEEELILYLENKEDPLPDYMISILRDVSNGSTYKSVLLRDMAKYASEKTRAAQDIIRSILIDTIVDHSDYRNWLDNIGGIEADKQIIGSYLSEGDTTNAFALLNLIPGLYYLQDEALDNFNDYKSMVEMEVYLENVGRSFAQLDSTEIAYIEFIADSSNGSAKSMARGILEGNYNRHFCDCLYVTDTTTMKSIQNTFSRYDSFNGLKITASPNPARNYVQFEWELPINCKEGSITVFNISGSRIKTFNLQNNIGNFVWDTRTVEPGVYLYTINSSGATRTGKVIINH